MRIGRLLEISFAHVPGEARPGQIVLAILVTAALLSLLLAHHMAWVFLPIILSFLSPVFRVEKLSRWAVAAAQYAFYAVLGGTILLAYILMAYPILSDQRVHYFTLLGGLGLAGFALGFLFGRDVWRPEATLIPCVLGMFVVAGFNGGAQLVPAGVLAALAGLAYLGSPPRPVGAPSVAPGRSINSRAAILLPPVLLIAAGIVGTLPRAQDRVGSVTANLMSNAMTNYSSFSVESRLGELEQLQLSGKVVMRVWSSHPQKLRGRIFTQFDGRTWKARGPFLEQLQPANSLPGIDPTVEAWLESIPGTSFLPSGTGPTGDIQHGTIRTKIVQAGFNPGLLVSPAGQVVVRTEASSISADAYQTLTTPLSDLVQVYGILNRRSGDLVQPGLAPPELLAGTKGLPERVDPRIVQLAQRLSGEATSDEARVRHTVQFVQNQCRYSLEVGKFNSQDPVAEFLFEKKRGYCEYFASAAAVLLRQQGIPCRYVTGFVVQEWNRQGGHFVVREADAHAWVEAYIPGRGWIEADPTPEAEYLAARARFEGGWIESAKEWVAGKVAEIFIYVRRGDWTAALRWFWRQIVALWGAVWTWEFGLVVLLAVAGFVAIRLLRKRPKAGGASLQHVSHPVHDATSPEARELISLVDGIWASKGLGRPASRAPLEHLAGLPADKIELEFRNSCQQAIEYFYSISFGNSPPVTGRILDLRRALERAAAAK